MEKKCLWLEFEEAKNEVRELKEEKRRCKDAIGVRFCYTLMTMTHANKYLPAERTKRKNRSSRRSAKERVD